MIPNDSEIKTMRLNSLFVKNVGIIMLTATIAIVGTLTVIKDSLIEGLGTERNLLQHPQFVYLAELHTRFYRLEGSWEKLRNNHNAIMQLGDEYRAEDGNLLGLMPPLPSGKPRGRKPKSGPRPKLAALRADPQFPPPLLLDNNKNQVYGRYKRHTHLTNIKALVVDGETVGYLGFDFSHITRFAKQRLAQEQERIFPMVGFIMLLVSLLIALVSSYLLLKPVRRLIVGTRQIKHGDYQTRIAKSSGDELGDLSDDFNDMAQELETSRDSRKRFLADISHEIRTPLAVIKSHVSAFIDGVRQPTPEAFARIEKRIDGLNRLLGDFHELSKSDAGALTYDKKPLCLVEQLDDIVGSFVDDFTEKKLTIETDIRLSKPYIITADCERLSQLFSNFMTNASRYTHEEGKLSISAFSTNGEVVVVFEDTAPGVSDEDLAQLFEPLFRAESSRSRITGGAGLGLAICSNIVAAHNGTIVASHSQLGGVKVEVRLSIKPT
ncbi:MAG: HAMP domain-containing protein [Algicola sp.]|nr:HAMP domain-containing protein [Algicola sp.]